MQMSSDLWLHDWVLIDLYANATTTQLAVALSLSFVILCRCLWYSLHIYVGLIIWLVVSVRTHRACFSTLRRPHSAGRDPDASFRAQVCMQALHLLYGSYQLARILFSLGCFVLLRIVWSFWRLLVWYVGLPFPVSLLGISMVRGFARSYLLVRNIDFSVLLL